MEACQICIFLFGSPQRKTITILQPPLGLADAERIPSSSSPKPKRTQKPPPV
ncbi:hypothetical protein CGMCC3_g1135 [Colletotrichum fructicola]|nr:uncharacterized protein CGMCC3_g1135 [Colletotrichum fructicola]KAE9582880.1 hypothetical protein CGMCC3_g1135 [Colletotrichum fructicola]